MRERGRETEGVSEGEREGEGDRQRERGRERERERERLCLFSRCVILGGSNNTFMVNSLSRKRNSQRLNGLLKLDNL